MIKLFVDDIRPEPKGWHRARTVLEAIRTLQMMAVEEVSLDHDIECYEPIHGISHSSEETFFSVARYIALMSKETRPKTIRIHTSNITKGVEMAELLGIPYTPYIYNEKDYEV